MSRQNESSPGIPQAGGDNGNRFYNVVIRSAEIGDQNTAGMYVRRVILSDVVMLLQLFCGKYFCEVYEFDGDED